MKRAYIEPSVIGHAASQGLSGSDLRSGLDHLDLEPVMGQHGIHELARTLVRGHRETGKDLFSIVADLDPVFHKPPSEFFSDELLKLRTGAAVIPSLDHLNQTLTRSEVLNMARGSLDRELRDIIESRDRDKAASFPKNTAWYMGEIAKLRKTDPKSVPELHNLEDVINYFSPDLQRFVGATLQGIDVTPQEQAEVTQRLNSFPAIRTHVRVWFYLMLIVLRDKRQPALDKLDDYRHIVEASYCDYLVTDDGQLAFATPQVHPGLSVLDLAALRGD